MAFGPGCGQAQGAAVAGGAEPLDDAVDPVPVALGVGEALEDDAGDALAERDAVGGGVEGAGAAGGGEGVDGGEQGEVVDAVVQVGAAAQDDVTRPGQQFLAGDVHRRQRGRAGRVHRVVGAAEVEAVGDTARDDVGEHAGERVLGEARELAVQRLRDLAVVRGQDGAYGRRVREVAARLRAEHHRGARAVELPPPVAVSGVVERAPGGLKGQQLDRLDAAEGGRRDAVPQRVEGDARQEAAPLGVGGRAVVDGGIPALRGDFGDRVDARDDVRPEGGEVGRPGEHAGHADDRDVQRRRCLRLDCRARRDPFGEEGHRAGRHRGVQRGDRRRTGTQHGHLPGHEHPLGELPLLVHGRQRPVLVALDPLAGDAQPAHVQPLQPLPHLPLGQAPRPQPGRLLAVAVRERTRHAAGGVTRRRLQQRRRPGLQHPFLEQGLDGALADGLLREEVRRPHQDADRRAPRAQRARERRDHRRRPLVVHPAREEHLHVRDVPEVLQDRQLGFPQRERGARTDVTAALSALEHEPPGARVEELPQQLRRRHVQERPDAGLLQRPCLGRTSARDDRVGRPGQPYRLQLGGAQFLRREAQHTHAPRVFAHRLPGLREHRPRPLAVRQSQRDERQRPFLGHGRRERRPVAHPRHRALRDGELGAECPAHRRVRAQCPDEAAVAQGRAHRAAHLPYRAVYIAPPVGEPGGEEAVLAHREPYAPAFHGPDAVRDGRLGAVQRPDESGELVGE